MNRKDIEGIYPLSPSQQGMLLESLAAGPRGLHVEQSIWKITGGLSVEVLAHAWQMVVDRHAILRTSFVWQGLQEPVQVVLRHRDTRLAERDLSALPAARRLAEAEALAEREARRGFDLARGPLMRLLVLKLSERDHQVIWSHHHLLMDGWCRGLLQQELLHLYRAVLLGDEPGLAPAYAYSEYVKWLKKQDLAEAEAFWRQANRGFRKATALGREVERPQATATFGVTRGTLSAQESVALAEGARRHGMTLAFLAQGLWAVLLRRYSGDEDVLFGVTVSGRPAELPGVESTIGLFINSIPIRFHVPRDTAFWPWLTSCKARHEGYRDHEYCASSQIHGWSEVPPGRPLYDSIFIFQNYPPAAKGALSGLDFEVGEEGAVGARTRHPLTVLIGPGPPLSIQVIHDASRLAGPDAERIVQHWLSLARRTLSVPASDLRIDTLLAELPEDEIPEVAASERRSQTYVAPRDVLELKLTRAWESALSLRPIGVRDRFFEIGGHSMTAVTLMAEIEEHLGVRVPLASLFENDTIEKMARRLKQEEATRPFASLVTIENGRPDAGRPPFVCVHPGGGTVLCYYELAARLGQDQPVYALQARGIHEGQTPRERVEEMASAYVEELLEARPDGPHHLAGWSFGGVVAYEMAQQLVERGHEVGLLALLDVSLPDPAADGSVESADLLVEIFGQDLALDVDELRPWSLEKQLVHVMVKAKAARLFPPGFTATDALRQWKVFMAHRKAERNYRPSSYRGELVVFRSDIHRQMKDGTLGWRRVAGGGVQTYLLSGNHQEILREPRVGDLAKILTHHLTE